MQSIEMPYCDSECYFSRLKNIKRVFLDSSLEHAEYGRYSFIAFDPVYVLTYFEHGRLYKDNDLIHTHNIFDYLNKLYDSIACEADDTLPPFQGGLAGNFSYDFGREIEVLPECSQKDIDYPLFQLGCFDVVLSFDHLRKKAWLISTGIPESDSALREKRAAERLQWACKLLDGCWKDEDLGVIASSADTDEHDLSEVLSDVTKSEYMDAIKKAKHYILDGDIFEVNLSQRFTCTKPVELKVSDIYTRLRTINPATFSSFVDLGGSIIASASPERFLKLNNGVIEARPIKGTRPRGETALEDEQLKNELLQSQKDIAENTMIVDLMRNDLSRVCQAHSIDVPQYCGLESYKNVHHLVSVIRGILRDDVTPFDVLRVTFPGGSITGAPKIRAMEIIDELEPTRRGPYCGSVGYISSTGDMDLSILIRSFVITDNFITFQTGGAIVLDSEPEQEYEEALIKATGLMNTIKELSCDTAY